MSMLERVLPTLVAALLAVPALAASPLSRGESYCCQEAGGRKICGDSLPEQCRGRAYRIIDSGGNLVREVGPPLTQEQKAQLAEESLRKKQQEEAAREQRRKDQALLDTYAGPGDIDLAQQKAEADIDLTIQGTRNKIVELEKRRKKLTDEAEFYKKQALPAELAKSLRISNDEIQSMQDLISIKNKDRDAIKAKYDADRKRYTELTGRRTASPAAPGKP